MRYFPSAGRAAETIPRMQNPHIVLLHLFHYFSIDPEGSQALLPLQHKVLVLGAGSWWGVFDINLWLTVEICCQGEGSLLLLRTTSPTTYITTMGLGLEIKSALMLALKFPLQNARQHPALNQAARWDWLPDTPFFCSYPLCSRESSQCLHGNDTEGKSPDAAWQRGERLGYL